MPADACTHLDQVADVRPSSHSYEPGEAWWFCYLDDLAFVPEGAPSFAHP